MKIEAFYQTGLSFEANNAPKLAERNYEEALKLLEAEDKEKFKALHYRLGRMCREPRQQRGTRKSTTTRLRRSITPISTSPSG